MIPAVTTVRLTGARNRGDLPLLVLGPTLGTSATTLWSACAALLTDAFDLVAWDLPGHGHNRTVPEEPFTMAELATGVLRVVDTVLEQREESGGAFCYAGASVGGAVGLQLLVDRPGRVTAAVLLGTAATLADPAGWHERSALVRSAGTDEGYAQVCRALADFDVRARLGEVAEGVQHGRFLELEGVGHLAPVEAPADVARLLRHHLLGEPLEPASDELVAALAAYDLDTAWERPHLDLRSRSLVTLAALAASGRQEQLASAVRVARTHGLTPVEIRELLLHTAACCEDDDAAASRVAQQVLAEEDLT